MARKTKKRIAADEALQRRAEGLAASFSLSPILAGIAAELLAKIATDLLPRLFSCLKPVTPDDVPAMVAAKWDPDQGYRPKFLARAATEAMQSAKRQGQRITSEQAREIAVKTLDDARLGGTEDVQVFGAAEGAWS